MGNSARKAESRFRKSKIGRLFKTMSDTDQEFHDVQSNSDQLDNPSAQCNDDADIINEGESDYIFTGDSDDSDSDNVETDMTLQVSGKEFSVTVSGIVVTVAKGDIAQQKVDAIVCGTPGSLDFRKSAIGKSILQAGGDGVQTQCQQKYPKGIKPGEVVSTSPGRLQCKQLLCACVPFKKERDSTKTLVTVFYKCLSLASQGNFRSLALPALGAGKLGYNRTSVAQCLNHAVDKFAKQHADSPLHDVVCVIHQNDTQVLQSFTSVLKQSARDVDTTERILCRIQVGNISVQLIVGNLTKQMCDVVVGTCTRKMELAKGSLSNAILSAVGPAMATECANKYPQGIQYGQLAILLPGNMSCSAVYLGALPRYDKPPEDAEQSPSEFLNTLMTKCLQQALTDKKSTMCFPTFGAGYLKYPPEVSARVMVDAIRAFSTNNRGVVLMLKIVLHPDRLNLNKNQKAFMSVFQQHSPSTGAERQAGASAIPERYTPEFCMYMYSITAHHPPEYWTNFNSAKTVKEWQLHNKDQPSYRLVDTDQEEFKAVENLVQKTWETGKVGHGRDARGLENLDFNAIKVTKVQRIENLLLYEKYANRRGELFQKAEAAGSFDNLENMDGIKQGAPRTVKQLDSSWQERLYLEVNEFYLFHGTKSDRVGNLLKEGIDLRLAQGGAVFGSAVYMAESSTKADQYTDEINNRRTGGLRMFLVKACLGEIKVMNRTKKYRRPPCHVAECGSDDCSHNERYDSIVEEGKYIFREFIVYDTHQAYPEYLITYDRVTE